MKLTKREKRELAIFKALTGISFCVNHTGKMKEMISLSTSVLKNAFCQKRSKCKKSICSKCYANRMTKAYKGLEKVLAINTKALTTNIFPVYLFPKFESGRLLRLEAFGDLNNEIQVINYFRFCERNYDCKIALWTKNPFLIDRVIKKGFSKPQNLIIIYSNPILDKLISDTKLIARYPFIDKVFSVFTKDYAKAETITINCGARNCFTCQRCYSTKTGFHVNELVK